MTTAQHLIIGVLGELGWKAPDGGGVRLLSNDRSLCCVRHPGVLVTFLGGDPVTARLWRLRHTVLAGKWQEVRALLLTADPVDDARFFVAWVLKEVGE